MITSKNSQLIEKFKTSCYAEGLGKLRVDKYFYTLKQLSLMLNKDFDKVAKKDIINLVSIIERREWSDWTKHDYKVTIKKFYKWLRGKEEYPEEVKWIKTTVKKRNGKLPEGLLTEEEIKKLIDSASNSRDKALISVLYESGCRAGEILSLKLKSVEFDKYGCVILVDGKTGMRRIRLVNSTPYLKNWVNDHPHKEDPNFALWIVLGNNTEKGIIYTTLRHILERIGERANIKKSINPHHFRHSRATFLANHLTESQLNEYLGWVQGSGMPSIYVHMSGRDVDKAIKKMYGLVEEEEKKESILTPKNCPRCNEINPATSKFCNKCSLALDFKIAIELEDKRKKSDSIINQFVKKITEKYPDESVKILEELNLVDTLREI